MRERERESFASRKKREGVDRAMQNVVHSRLCVGCIVQNEGERETECVSVYTCTYIHI